MESIAEQLGVSQSTLLCIEAGQHPVNVDFVEKVEKCFDLTPSLLLNLCEFEDERPIGEILTDALKVFEDTIKEKEDSGSTEASRN